MGMFLLTESIGLTIFAERETTARSENFLLYLGSEQRSMAIEPTGGDCESEIGRSLGVFSRANEPETELAEEHPVHRRLANRGGCWRKHSVTSAPTGPHQGGASHPVGNGFHPGRPRFFCLQSGPGSHTHSAPSSLPTLSAKVSLFCTVCPSMNSIGIFEPFSKVALPRKS